MLAKLKIIGLSILAVFAPIRAIMATAMFLVIIDLITGLWAAKKRGESITSAGFNRTIVKTLVYQSAIMIGFLTEQYLTGDMAPVSKIITSYIGLTECLSVIENINTISGGSILKSLIDKLGSQNAKD